MARGKRNYSFFNLHSLFILSIVLLFVTNGAWAAARSITGVERIVSSGEMFLNVTFEAGETSDNHALYIAYDTEDKGADISNWAELQRGCNVAADATSATIPVSPLLTGKGYTVCRVFLTTSAVPYDTQIEYLRQSGEQYIDTGIKPDATSVAVMDTKFDSNNPTQQRFFGISSGNSAAAGLSFDCYINGSGKFASACKNGKGDWKEAGTFTTDRVRISLSALERHHITITNLVTGAQIANKTYNTTCTATSVTNLHVFALYNVDSWSIPEERIAKGARLYSFTMSNSSGVLCDYKPCKLGDRVGVYDTVTGKIIYSASGTDFVAEDSGSPVACSLLDGEMQLSAAPSATFFFFDYTWRGTAANWGDTDAWTKEGNPAKWVEGNNAIFATANATATLAADATANSIAFSADATVGGTGELIVKSVSVDSGVSATISAPISSDFEKNGVGTLTLTENRTAATTVTEGTLKMDGASIADLTLGTDGGTPVMFDYGGQELVRNPRYFLVTGSTVTLTNGIFSTPNGHALSLRDELSPQTLPSVLTIAKDATLRGVTAAQSVYICKGGNGSSTINIAGGVLEQASGNADTFIQHKSVSGRVNINVTEGGLLRLPGDVYALCRGDIAITSPSLYMTFANSVFSVGTAFQFGSSYNKVSYVPAAPTGVFAATNSAISIGTGFWVGRNVSDAKSAGSFTVDLESCVVTARYFAVHHDRPLNNARFNDTRFVFNAAGGYIEADDGAGNWFTVGADGLILDTRTYSATLNANLGGSGTVTKVGTGTLTVSRNQDTTGGIRVEKGTLAIKGRVSFAGPVAFAADTTLDIATPATTDVAAFAATTLNLPAEGTVALTSGGGAFGEGLYAICKMSGVTAEAGAKFAPSTGGLAASWKVDGDMLMLKVGDNSNIWTGAVGDGDLSNPQNWYGGQVPTSGTAIFNCGAETSLTKGDTFAPTSITFGPGCAPVTINSGNLTGIVAVTNLSSVVQTINCPVTFADNYRVHCASAAVNFSGGATATCPVSDMTDNAATRALTGNITFTEDWTATGSMNNKYTVPSGSRLCGKHLTGNVDNKTFLCVQAGGYAEFDSILTGKALGRVSVQGELVVHDKWVATATANYNHIGEDNSSTETGILRVSGLWKGDDTHEMNKDLYVKVKNIYIGKDGLGAKKKDYAIRFQAYDIGGYLIHATEDFEIFSPLNSNNPADWGLKFEQPVTLDTSGHTITWTGGAQGTENGTVTKTGEGTLVMNPYGSSMTGAWTVDEGTLALAKSDVTGTGAVTVKDGAALEVAQSGTVALGGNLTLENGAILAFNFTKRTVAPQIAIAEGKTLTVKGAVNVKIPADSKWPTGGEKILTTCGGFNAEGVTVSFAEDAPKWAKRVYVNEDGNIVLDVKPRGTRVIVR